MLRQIFSALAFASFPLIAACQSSPEIAETGWMSGRIVTVDGAPVPATITIGEMVYETDEQGRFDIAPAQDLIYRMEIEADGFYAMRQTFSHAELTLDPSIDDVVLVSRKPGRTLFVFGGDAMIGRRFYQPFEGEPVLVSPASVGADSIALLTEMKPYLERADYASINLETPIFRSRPSEPAQKSVTFYSAPETLDALEWAGVDYVALGNNHIYDFLEPGLDVTLEHLKRSNLDYSGGGKTEADALKPFRHEHEANMFDFLSYVGWEAGPQTQTAEESKGGAAFGNTENLLSTTKASIANQGIPVLQFHGGLEYVEEPSLSVETKLKRAVDAGAALIIGHHPHVVQGLELYQGKLIAWSLGNFLFDQYFYSAQSAALLYVWTDGDEFHRAEAVPLYIKGYHPTPAVGPMRNKINRRLHQLSAKRNTFLERSGGHLVLAHEHTAENTNVSFDMAQDCQGGAMRLGHDLLARGDFDAHTLFDAKDRSWLDLDQRVRISADPSAPWDFQMQIDVSAENFVRTGMRKFQRVFTPGTPMSVRADIASSADVEIDVYLQIRATGQTLEDALQNGKEILLGTVSVQGGERTKLDIDFDSPRTRARSIRVLLDVKAKNADALVTLDNLEFIEWKTPFRSEGSDCRPLSTEH